MRLPGQRDREERPVAEPEEPRVAAREGERARAGQQAADEDHRAEDVHEQREVPAVGPDGCEEARHAPGFQIMSMRIRSTTSARERVQEEAALRPVDREQLGARARLAGRLELLGLLHPGHVLRAGALRRAPPAIAQSTIAAMIQPSQMSYPPTENASQMPKTIVPPAPIPTAALPTFATGAMRIVAVRRVGPPHRDDQDPEEDHARDERERAQDVERKDPVVEAHAPADPMTMDASVDATARHLRLLTETIAAVNSSLDLQEVLELVASKVADALGTDACFVYLYDERADELVLRATHGTPRRGADAHAADAARARGSPASRPPSARR